MPIKKFPTIMPTIYDKFQCKCDTCRNTCCQRWTINITRGEYNKLRHRCKSEKMESFLDRVPRKNATDTNYATVRLNSEGYCPYLTNDKMCGMQLEHGYNILPHICKVFPRIYKQINPNLHAFSLDTGCERTLELLWEEAETGLRFHHDMRDELALLRSDIESNLSFSGFSDYITDIQNLCIWLLQNRAYSLSDRMIILGLAMRELQEIQDTQAADRIPVWFMKWQTHTKGNALAETLAKLNGNSHRFLLNNCGLLFKMQTLTSASFLQFLCSTIETSIECIRQGNSFSCNLNRYIELDVYFQERFPNSEKFFENFLVMTAFRLVLPFQTDSVWKSYLYLCSFYSFLRFVAVTSAPNTAKELIDTLVLFSRTSLNTNFFDFLTSETLEISHSDSLAHAVILLRG